MFSAAKDRGGAQDDPGKLPQHHFVSAVRRLAVCVVCAHLLAEADYQHLLNATAHGAAKIGVGLYPVQHHDAVCLQGRNTEDDVDSVEAAADFRYLHAGFDGHAHAFGGYPVTRQ